MKGVFNMNDFKTGDRVRITSGQYMGLIGKLRGVSKDSGRCTVELEAGADPALLDNCYFTSIVEIERAPETASVTKPKPKDFPDLDLDAMAAVAKEKAKAQPTKAEPRRPMFSRKSKQPVAEKESNVDESMDFEEIFVDDFAVASSSSSHTEHNAQPKEFSAEPKPVSVAEPTPEPIPEPVIEPIPSAEPDFKPLPSMEQPEIQPIPAMREPEIQPIPSVEAPEIKPLPSMETPQQESQPKEMSQKSMENKEFIPKFRQEMPPQPEFIPLPCKNCRLRDQRENCSSKEFSECQAAYAFDEYLKEHSIQLFVEQILIPEMNQAGVTETEKKAMLQRLLLEL